MNETLTKIEAPSLLEMMSLIGQQARRLAPGEKCTVEDIAAARATASLVNTYVGGIKVGLAVAKMTGERPDVRFLQLAEPKAT